MGFRVDLYFNIVEVERQNPIGSCRQQRYHFGKLNQSGYCLILLMESL